MLLLSSVWRLYLGNETVYGYTNNGKNKSGGYFSKDWFYILVPANVYARYSIMNILYIYLN